MSLDLPDTDGVVEVNLDDLLASLRYEGTAAPTDDEAAAIAAALSAHLTDRQRAAAAAEESTPTVSDWTLAGRLDAVGTRSRRRPRSVERGDEWKAAARSL
jgi:hypothetical protein